MELIVLGGEVNRRPVQVPLWIEIVRLMSIPIRLLMQLVRLCESNIPVISFRQLGGRLRYCSNVKNGLTNCSEDLEGHSIEVDSFAFNHQRPLLYLSVDLQDVFAEQADEEQLYRGEEKEADQYGRETE